jgi:anti-sigma regulatory factor (Ser/Thr protein kinase)
LGALAPGHQEDDIALLVARFDGTPSHDVAHWSLCPSPQTPAHARRLVRHALARWGLESLWDSTELLVSVVVTNAVRHARQPISLRLLRTDVLLCEVGDDSTELPRVFQAAPDDEHGRGMYLVDRMTLRWNTRRLTNGKVVWFEQQLPRTRARPGAGRPAGPTVPAPRPPATIPLPTTSIPLTPIPPAPTCATPLAPVAVTPATLGTRKPAE